MNSRPAVVFPEKALVIGMGVSGRFVTELLLREGVRTTATDLRPREQFKGALDHLEEKGCALRLGTHVLEDFLETDQIVVSPGVPLDLGPLREARAAGIEIVGELEWAWRLVNLPVVAVTGTNGKTTTTSLVGEMFRAAGKRAFVGGNIGSPLSEWLVRGGEADTLILEVSSFQLDTAPSFRPDVGVLLNVTEDHLDRYDDFNAYVDSKFSLFSRQGAGDTAVINVDDPICRAKCFRVPGRLLTSSRKDGRAHAVIDGRTVRVRVPWLAPFDIDLEGSALRGAHNEENVLVAALAAAVMGVEPEALQKAVNGYRVLPHRVERVGSWQGIEFYDDSKATNVGAVVKALEGFDGPVLLLLGGRDKLGSYEPLIEPLRQKGKGAFVFGEAAARIRDALEKHVHVKSFPNLEEAFEGALEGAEKGDVVLLSPACSSFDQYESYARRGDHFKSLVRRLGGGVLAA